jgi:hypothetical protein
VGKTSKRRLGMGARVHVIVTSVNPIEGLVDLALVEIEKSAQRRPQKSPQKSAHKSQKGRRGREK